MNIKKILITPFQYIKYVFFYEYKKAVSIDVIFTITSDNNSILSQIKRIYNIDEENIIIKYSQWHYFDCNQQVIDKLPNSYNKMNDKRLQELFKNLINSKNKIITKSNKIFLKELVKKGKWEYGIIKFDYITFKEYQEFMKRKK